MTYFNVQKYLKNVFKIIWIGIQWTICGWVRLDSLLQFWKCSGHETATHFHLVSKLKHCTVTPSSFVFMVWRFIKERETFTHSHGYSSTVRTIDLRHHVRGSVHHSIIDKENPTRWNSVSKFYFIFIWSSTCFGQYAAHHQETKTALEASGFA